MTTALPDVPQLQDPSHRDFLQRVKLAIKVLEGDVETMKAINTAVGSFTHEQVSDFTKAVLDVLGGGGLVAGIDNIQVSYDPSAGTITVDGLHTHPHTAITDFTEAVQDVVGATLVSGTGIGIVYNDAAGTITITNTGSGTGGSSPPFLSSDITDFTEAAQDAVAAALISGAGISITYNDAANQITVAATGGGSGAPVGYIGAFENNIKLANSATTNTTNLNALIASLSASGGGTITFAEGGVYFINGNIILRQGVDFARAGGAMFAWQGATSGEIFSTRNVDVITDMNLDIVIDEGPGFNGTVFHLHSCQNSFFKFRGHGNSTGSIFCHISADSISGEWPSGGRNFVFNYLEISHRLRCGIGLLTDGLSPGGSSFMGQGQVVTLCEFHNLQFSIVSQYGIRPDNWSDSITLSGNTYVAVDGVNSRGFENNPASPTVPTGVYNWHWDHFAVDTFGSVAGRKGVVLNAGHAFSCDSFFQDPVAEGGPFDGTHAISYDWTMKVSGSNSMVQHVKGWSQQTP